ncbi:MAG: HAD-IC family P-type ATPase, partial [Syntrophobacteraceae bacterium]|nr:HAD-IC family P-type ATPase [Syntrophobacteraceae bacterium]
MKRWHELEVTQVIDSLRSDGTNGLSRDEADRRLSVHGPNQLKERNLRGAWRIFQEQLTSTMVVILIIAAVLSWLLGDRKDAMAILVIVILNAMLGFRQEFKAEKAMAALKAMAVPDVRVCREGQVIEVPAHAIVPGDLLIIEAGNVVPADARVVESKNLQTQEASLTGESQPVSKVSNVLEGEGLTLADRKNMVFMGTFVTYGRGRAVVTATGMETELGHIADLIQTVGNEPTPLQKRLAQVGRGLAMAALAIVAIVFLIGIGRGESAREMFLVSISLAVAAVPEGLPAVVTITL